MGSRKLVIVESPNKIKTFKKILGSDFDVQASVGHYKMLDPKSLSVDVENNFTPSFQVDPNKKNVLQKILAESIGKDIYIATDPDQEGYAIGKFLYDDISAQGKSNKIYKVEIRAITQQGIKDALTKVIPFKETNFKEFDAFLARRISDRLIGYMVSPLLSNEFKAKHSAGRVQSPAVALLVDREEEIKEFKALPEEQRVYYSISLEIEDEENNKQKILLKLDKDETIANIEEIKKIAIAVKKKQLVLFEKVIEKEIVDKAPRPYMSLTLLSDLSNKFKIPPEKGMTFAIQLFEKGFITYPRTDSERIDESFLDEIKTYISENYPGIYKKRQFKTSGTQADAHEGIRNSHILENEAIDYEFSNEDTFTRTHKNIYKLIMATTLSSQAKDAIIFQKEFIFYSPVVSDGKRIAFSATNKVVKEENYLKIMQDIANIKPKYSQKFPLFKVGVAYKILSIEINKKERNAPSRYTEASLLRKLKKLGIGRPSTYATILGTIKKRGYCIKKGQREVLLPTDSAFEVIAFLREKFPWIIDYNFTKEMELFLDKIVSGEQTWETFCDIVYEKLGRPKYEDIQFNIKPSKKQLEFAINLSKVLKVELPENYEVNAKVLSIWIDSQKEAYKKYKESKKPSKKQLDFATKIASKNNIKIPEEVLSKSKLLSEWIDKQLSSHKTKANNKTTTKDEK